MNTFLMVGDLVNIWVYPRDKKQDLLTAKVIGIMTKIGEDDVDIMEGRILSTNGIFSRPLEDYEPIPLTEEMLKNNGFVFNIESEDLHYRSYHIKNFVVLWNTNTNDLSMILLSSGVKLNYVHELQHVLRVGGLGRIADEFKI